MTELEIRTRLGIPDKFEFTDEMKNFYDHLVSERLRSNEDKVRVWINGKVELMPVRKLMVFVDRGRKDKIGVYDNSKLEKLNADFVVIKHSVKREKV